MVIPSQRPLLIGCRPFLEDARQQAQRLLELIGALPQAQREAFLLQQESDMSIEEIAEATGVSRETAKSRLRYAIAKLRQGIRE